MTQRFIVIIFVLFFSASALSENPLAGHVIISKGSVTAVDAQGSKRALKRRSEFYVGDTLLTGPMGTAQLRFVDNALMTLKPNSELNISAYRYQQQQASGDDNQVLMELVKGGFRTITGQVGKGNKNAYKVQTPAASIGIRGTNFEVQQETQDTFVMAVYSGGIRVENPSGVLNLGADADFNYVRVSPQISPKGLLSAPDSLSGNDLSSTQDDENSGEDENTDEGSDESESQDDNQDSDTDENTDESTDENTVEGGSSANRASASTTANSTVSNTSQESQALDQTLNKKVTQSVTDDDDIKALLDQLGDNASLADLADAINSGNPINSSGLFDFDQAYVGLTSVTNTLSEHLTNDEFNLLESGKLMAVALPAPYDASTLLLQGGAVRIESPEAAAMVFNPNFAEATINIHCETLSAPEGFDIQVVIGSNWGGSDIAEAINLYIAEVLSGSGQAVPFHAVMVPFDSDGDNIDDSYKLAFEQVCSTTCTDPITELEIRDVAIGLSDAERNEVIAALGGLNGESDESRARLENELVITNATWSQTTDGPILVMEPTDDQGVSEGKEIIKTPAADRVVTNMTDLQNCSASETCTIKVEKVDGLPNVSWGAWLADPDNPITIVDLADGTSQQETQFMAFWVAAEPANLNQLTGTANFSASDVCSDFSKCLGFTDDGMVQNFSGNFAVDFNSGAITNGNLTFQSGPAGGTAQSNWQVNFSGQMGTDATGTRQPGFITESLNGSVSTVGGTTLTDTVVGNVGGLFVKPGDNFVGGYNVTGVMQDGNHKKASGVFKLDKQ